MGSFSDVVNKFCTQEARDKIDRTVRITVMEIGNRLVMRSPVGDPSYWQSPPPPGYSGGRFRANWQYSFGQPIVTSTDAIDKSGMSTISRINMGAMTSPGIGVHYITNNVPYAERIENGWSYRQAPNGVVALTEVEFTSIFNQAAKQ